MVAVMMHPIPMLVFSLFPLLSLVVVIITQHTCCHTNGPADGGTLDRTVTAVDQSPHQPADGSTFEGLLQRFPCSGIGW